jgi:Domain of unknown function (DUF4136)
MFTETNGAANQPNAASELQYLIRKEGEDCVNCTMPYRIRYVVTFGLLAAVLVSYGQSMKTTDLKKADFSKLRTFMVAKGEFTVPSDERNISENTFYERIKSYVRRELELRGYIFKEDTIADFTVDYVAGAFNVNQNENLGPLGGTPATDPSMMNQSRYWSKSFREGLLLLEIYRGRSDNLLWKAEGTVDLTNEDAGRIVSAAIARAFKKFPKQENKQRRKK